MTNEKGLDKGYELVAKMHEVFGHPVTNTPTKLTEERAKNPCKFYAGRTRRISRGNDC